LLSRQEFEDQYALHSQAIYRFLYWQSRDLLLAEDLASSTFERAWRARSSFDGGSARAWLYRIARNLLTDHWRRQKTLLLDDMLELEDEDAPNLAKEIDRRADALLLRAALAKLPDRLRLVLVLRFIEGLSSVEAAEVMQVAPGNVRVLQYRALKQMKELLDGKS
jgi:RNA polymerase sigma-70 factor, ECF subfamily